MIAILVLAFVLSGAAGLIYESLWSRYLGLFVGHSAYAQIIVLVVFLGGMSLGAHLAGRRSERLRAPLLWYAGVEIAVGMLALIFHDAFGAVTALAYDSIFPSLGGIALTVVKWGIASALILPQSILLGMTFPLMSAGVIRLARADQAPGGILALLYFANSLGAAAGVLFAGFVLLEEAGLPGTLVIAAILNVVAAVVVGLIARRSQRADEVAHDVRAPAPVRDRRSVAEWRPLLAVAFGTAIASFVYEIAWIRMLSLVLGSATHSFELMLSAFILGLALGALWVRGRADRIPDPVRFLGRVQWVMGILAVITLPLYVASFDWIGVVIRTVQENEAGYRAFLVARYAVSLLIMLPATFCAGMTLPLITKVLMRAGVGEQAIGAVYAVNTLGSIVGTILAGLLLMPVLGLKLLLVFGALVDIGLGIWLTAIAPRFRSAAAPQAPAAKERSSRLAVGSPLTMPIVATAALLLLVFVAAPFDLARLTSGVYRHGVVAHRDEFTFPYYHDGRTATVSMREGGDGFRTLATNGKPDASMEKAWRDTLAIPGQELTLNRDIATQMLLPLITLAHAPTAQHMAVIGHGSGMSSHVLLGSPYARQVVTIEIEPEMIEASRFFLPANHRVFDDPRSAFAIDDAKSYFASTPRRFDLILSEPSNPWVSGVSGLFTLEFYQRVQQKLAPNGVFGQWLHLYELSDGLVVAVLAAIDAVFPAYEVFYTSNADILVVASNAPLRQPFWRLVAYPGIARDLRRAVPLTPEFFESLRLGGRDVLRPVLLARGAPNSDYYPVLDLGAERMRFMRESATGFMTLDESRFDVVAALANRREGFGSVTVSATPEIERPSALALGARLRALRTLPADVVAQLPRDDALRRAVYRLDALERMAASSVAPADWHAWMQTIVDADKDLHEGTSGVVDTTFFGQQKRFAARTGAPAEARAALDFLEAIGRWDWPTAVIASKALMASADTVPWIPTVLLRNGAVVAHIKVGDRDGARQVLETFANRTEDDAFRARLLGSYLTYADSVRPRGAGLR